MSKLINRVDLAIGMSTMLMLTTTIPVSGQEGQRCASFEDPQHPTLMKEYCCPDGKVWSTAHNGAPGTYYDCEEPEPGGRIR